MLLGAGVEQELEGVHLRPEHVLWLLWCVCTRMCVNGYLLNHI